jgi:hypothetical protein
MTMAMPTAQSIEFEHLGIGAALKRYRLTVPRHQREYRWRDTHVMALFQDLADAIDNNMDSYFLGTIVTTPFQGMLVVQDGQQRLATTTILLAAIRDYFESRNDELLTRDLNAFLSSPDRDVRDQRPVLSLNVIDNEYFSSRILLSKADPRRRKAEPQAASHHLIETAAQLAEKHIQQVVAPHSDPRKFDQLIKWVNFLEHRTLVMLLRVSGEADPYVIFETLNDRGLKTTQSDLVKSYLFGEVDPHNQSDPRLDEAQQRWAAMNATLDAIGEDDGIPITYLRHAVISLYGYTKEKEVLARVKEKVVGQGSALDFLSLLNDAANDYLAMVTPSHARWNGHEPLVRDYIETLNLVQLTPMMPLMLSVVRKFSKRQVPIALRQLSCWSVRYLIAGGGRSGVVEQAFARVASEISNGHIPTPAKMREALEPVLPNDLSFKAAFSTASVRKADLARYYLRAMEYTKQSVPNPETIQEHERTWTLEHVLPEKPNGRWPEFKGPLHGTYYARIGNLCMLRARPNTEVGNRSFVGKRQAYMESTFLLTQEVGLREQWHPSDIDERQRGLAELAVLTWPLH